MEYGAKALPLTSLARGVALKREAVVPPGGEVGERLMTSPPPLVIPVAAPAAPSLSRVRVTVELFSEAVETPPFGRTRSSTTLVVSETPVARLAGALVRTAGTAPDAGTLAMST